MQVSVDTSEIETLVKDVERFTKLSTRRKVLRAGLRSYSTPFKRNLRKRIRSTGSIRHKFLVKSIVSKQKIYNSGNFAVVIGARDRVHHHEGRRINPGKYFHLVDLGVQRHDNSGGNRNGSSRRSRSVSGQGGHPGFAPRNIRKYAADQSFPAAMANFREKYKSALDKEWEKLAGT